LLTWNKINKEYHHPGDVAWAQYISDVRKPCTIIMSIVIAIEHM